MKNISLHLSLHEDICNVYVLSQGETAVLVDFASGNVLTHLADISIQRIEAILMTHHHRDQGEGLGKVADAKTTVWVPHMESDLFSDVDAHWQSRELYSSYNNRQDRYSLFEPLEVAGTLRDYASYTFAAFDFEVLPTPGHTPGSLTLLSQIDGMRVAFCGDLIAAPGKLWDLAATQWTYNGAEGIAATVASLIKLKAKEPDLLLPSHGSPITKPAQAIDLLVERLLSLLHARGDNVDLLSWHAAPFKRLTPHLLWNRTSFAYSFVLLSDSGKALFFDYGYDFTTGMAAGSDRAAKRPTLYTLEQLKLTFGVDHVDVVIPTHYHDDHVAGLNLLQEIEGTEVWAAENFAEILERPHAYNLPCLWYDAIKVDRVLPLDTSIQWEEYNLRLYAQPGHTTYATAVFFTVDNQRVLVIGDQYQDGTKANWNYVYNNGFANADYIRSAALYRHLNPELILSGHWAPHGTDSAYFDRLDERGRRLAELHSDLELTRASGDLIRHGTYRLEPYQLEIARKAAFEVRVVLVNLSDTSADASVRLQLPDGWAAAPNAVDLEMAGSEERKLLFIVTPNDQAGRRWRVGAEVYLDSRRLSPVAEMLVTLC